MYLELKNPICIKIKICDIYIYLYIYVLLHIYVMIVNLIPCAIYICIHTYISIDICSAINIPPYDVTVSIPISLYSYKDIFIESIIEYVSIDVLYIYIYEAYLAVSFFTVSYDFL